MSLSDGLHDAVLTLSQQVRSRTVLDSVVCIGLLMFLLVIRTYEQVVPGFLSIISTVCIETFFVVGEVRVC